MTRAIVLMARCPALAAREAAVHCGQSRCLHEKITGPHRHPASRRALTHSRGAAVTTAVMDPNAFPSPPGRTTAQPRGAPPGGGPQKRVRDSLGVAGNNDRTWQDRLGGLKTRGPGAGKNGPRRVIKRTVTKPSEAAVPKPPTVAGEREWARVETMRAQQAAAEARRRGADGRDVSSTSVDDDITNAPWQKEETVSYSFFGQSRVRYPAASLADPASRATYEDSELDKTAIQVNALLLAEGVRTPPTGVLAGGDVRSFAALAEAAHHLRRQHSPEDLRRIVGKIMRSQITGGIPPGGTGVAQAAFPARAEAAAAAGTIASEIHGGVDVRADDAGDDGGTEREGRDGGERQEVQVPRGDGVRGGVREHVQVTRAGRDARGVWRGFVRGAKLCDLVADVLWAGAAAGADRSGAEQGVPVAVRGRGDEHAAAPAAAAGAADRHGRVAGGGGVDGGFGGEVLRLASAAASPEVPGAAEEGPGHLTTNASSVV